MKRRRPLRILLALSLSLLASLVVVEVLLRVFDLPGDAEEDIYFGAGWELGGFDKHPTRFYALAPGHRYREGLAGRFATGDWPYRGRAPGASRTPGALRIAVLGDSCIYGFALDARDTVPERIRVHLQGTHAWGDLSMINLGTPAYTTYQIALLAQEELAQYEPDLVVVYPAAWNDQSPAMWKKDVTIISGPPAGDVFGLVNSRGLAVVQQALDRFERGPRLSRAEVFARWRVGPAPYDTRIPEADLPGHLDDLLAACSAAAPTLVVAPAHSGVASANQPRVDRDSDAVLAAAKRHGLSALDAREILAASKASDRELFIDQVHLKRAGTEVLGRAIAAWIADHVDPAQPESSALGEPVAVPLRITELSRSAFSCFGEESVRIELEGWSQTDPLPEVWVGATALVEVRADGANAIVGATIADGPGPIEVLVRTASGRAARSAERVLPRIEQVEAPDRFRFHSRPGDQAHIHAAERLLAVPAEMAEGRYGLDGPQGRTVVQVTAGDDGTAFFELPEGFRGSDGIRHMQAIVVPAGEPVDTIEKRWSQIATIGGPQGGSLGAGGDSGVPGGR